MKKLFTGLTLFIVVVSYAQSYAQSCNCPANEFGYPEAKKADTVFHLSNGESIALCGYRDTKVAPGRTFFSEFVLAACGEKSVIKFWGAVLDCQLHVHKDTLIVETLDSLPAGKNMQYRWTVWTIERIFFKNGKATKDFRVNRQIPKYNEHEIQSALKQYERAVEMDAAANNPNRVNNVHMEIADKLFISATSGSQKAKLYLKQFKNHFGGLSGEYLEWYDEIMKKLSLWDTGYNPEAMELNDSAVALVMNPPRIYKKVDFATRLRLDKATKDTRDTVKKKPEDTMSYTLESDSVVCGKAISLLDKALQIDSNYFIAYWNKSAFENRLKRYKDALATGKQMIRLRPSDTTIRYLVGKIYYKTGDTIQAKVYYQDYLTYCNHRLDTMSVKNNQYKFMELHKAFVLILLNQPNKGHEILEKLYREADDFDRDSYSLYRQVTKADLVEGKKLSMSVGDNKTISVSLDF